VIERLTGTVAAKSAEGVVVEVGGVGFLLEVSAITLRDVGSVGETVKLYAHLHVTEDALRLFGFSSEEERELFRMLLGVSKIGPRLALAVLSVRRPLDLKRALAAGDVALLSSVSGIGKKTAERIVLELREKMGDLGTAGAGGATGGVPVDEGAVPLARAALVELGFNVLEADKLLASLDATLPVEELVRQALSKR
jgi:holliday junction DNA helicase RuvA